MSVSSSDCSMIPSMQGGAGVVGIGGRLRPRGSGRAGRTGRSSTRRRGSAGRAGRRPRRSSSWQAATVASGRHAAWSHRATTTARGIPTAAHSSHWVTVAGSIVPSRPGGGGDDEQRGVGGAQPGPQLTDEVAVAGGVDQVDLRVGAVRVACIGERRPARPSAAGGRRRDRGRTPCCRRRRCLRGESCPCGRGGPRRGWSSPPPRVRRGRRCGSGRGRAPSVRSPLLPLPCATLPCLL